MVSVQLLLLALVIMAGKEDLVTLVKSTLYIHNMSMSLNSVYLYIRLV